MPIRMNSVAERNGIRDCGGKINYTRNLSTRPLGLDIFTLYAAEWVLHFQYLLKNNSYHNAHV